jgi:prepilin-type N-terminal cleavage/methylation domain-containing protein
MRRAFTLLEVMIVVAIMATMAVAGLVSIRTGQSAARIRGAARDIVATIRHSRSKALVLMQPVVVTYSVVRADGEVCAQVASEGAKLIDGSPGPRVQTLTGEPVSGGEGADGPEEDGASAMGEGGETVADILCTPIATEVVKGVRLKVTMGDEKLESERTEEKKANRISVFSNVDYLLGRYKEKKAADEEKEEGPSGPAAPPAAADEDQKPVSVVWEANGRCDPHRVWVYLDGTSPEDGLCIKVDRFGATRVLPGSGEEGED